MKTPSIITKLPVNTAFLLALQVIAISASTSITHASASVNSAELTKWYVQQHQLYQLRSNILSEALAKRLSSAKAVSSTPASIPTFSSVSVIDGASPVPTDWECAISTEENPKSCLYSFDAPLNAKVIAPAGTTQWISLYALNRLRRLDPTKVEPMWHNQYTIINSWFGTAETSVLQHVGVKGWLVSNVLLDTPLILRTTLALTILIAFIAFLPIFEYFFNAFILNSSFVWSHYHQWERFLHAAFPFKLLVAQMTWKLVATKLDALFKKVRDNIVDIECQILEETIPVTGQEDDVVESDTNELEPDEINIDNESEDEQTG
jgi:hypothetical protein